MEPSINQIALARDLWVAQVGLLNDAMRLVLAPPDSEQFLFVLELSGPVSFFHKPNLPAPITISLGEVGSFGWWLRDRAAYKQLSIRSKNDDEAILLAIARSVTLRPFCAADDLNFPG